MKAVLFKFLSLASIIIICLSSCNTKQEPITDEEKISQLINDTYFSVCNGNWELYSKLMDHSSKVQLMHPDNGVWLKGYEEIKKVYEPLIKSGMKCNISVNDLIINISESGDMAWVITDITVKYGDDPNSQSSHMWEIVVLEKIEGQWKGVFAQSTSPKTSTKE